jgi:hypothetical protein
MKHFTEKETEKFYDKEDELYTSFWDREGSLHWGLFDFKHKDFLDASKNLTNYMLRRSSIRCWLRRRQSYIRYSQQNRL